MSRFFPASGPERCLYRKAATGDTNDNYHEYMNIWWYMNILIFYECMMNYTILNYMMSIFYDYMNMLWIYDEHFMNILILYSWIYECMMNIRMTTQVKMNIWCTIIVTIIITITTIIIIITIIIMVRPSEWRAHGSSD